MGGKYMSHRVYAIPIYRLESDEYSSVPRGAHGFIDEQNSEQYCFMRWIPPNFGSSGPILTEHLIRADDLMIPIDLIDRARQESLGIKPRSVDISVLESNLPDNYRYKQGDLIRLTNVRGIPDGDYMVINKFPTEYGPELELKKIS